MLGHAQPVVDRAVARGREQPRRRADRRRRHAADLLHRLGAVAFLGDEVRPVLERVPIAALAHEVLVHQTFGDDDMRQRGQHRDVCAGPQRQVMRRLDMRHAHQVDAPRIDDDQLGALAQPLLHARGEHRMPVGRIGADEHHHVGMLDRIEILRSGRGAERRAQPVAGRRMADARAGVGVVVAKPLRAPASAPDRSLRRCSATR